MGNYQLASTKTNNNCITEDTDYLIKELRYAFSKAQNIDIIVYFILESGIRLLLDDLKEAVGRGVQIRILTGTYLNITQPSALYELKRFRSDGIDRGLVVAAIGERVIIVMGAINVIKSRVSGTFMKNNSCIA